MRVLCLTVVLFCALLQLVDAVTCVPGSTIPAGDDCNTCRCPSSGLTNEAICTLYACFPKDVPDIDECTIGETFALDVCNSCNCISGSKKDALCTKKTCNIKGEDKCNIGTEFTAIDGVNTCKCTTGLVMESACSKGVCPKKLDDNCPSENIFFTSASGCPFCQYITKQ